MGNICAPLTLPIRNKFCSASCCLYCNCFSYGSICHLHPPHTPKCIQNGVTLSAEGVTNFKTLASAKSFDEAEDIMKQVFKENTHEELIIKYFGYYILEHLSIWFYEHLVRAKGKTECTELFRQLKNFIQESLKKMQKKNPLQKVDWGSDEADKLIKNIQQDVLTIFD